MAGAGGIKSREITFCANVQSWAEELFRDRRDLPFGSAGIEQSAAGSRKPQDLRFYTRDRKGVRAAVAREIVAAFESLCSRSIGSMVEQAFMDCRSAEKIKEMASQPLVLPDELTRPDRRALDEAVFEMLGVQDPARRAKLVDRLYRETAMHFRQIRIVEVQKLEQRRRSEGTRFSATELAGDIWDALEGDWKVPLADWLSAKPGQKIEIILPEGPAHLTGRDDIFFRRTVFFGKERTERELPHRGAAELVVELSKLGLNGRVEYPAAEAACRELFDEIRARVERARKRFVEMAASRTGVEDLKGAVEDLLLRWFLFGKEPKIHVEPEPTASPKELEVVNDPGHRAYVDMLPLVSLSAAAGAVASGEAVEEVGWVDVPERRGMGEGWFVARVKGRSMVPTIRDGAYCRFRPYEGGSRQGRILLIQHRDIHDPETGGSYTIKRYVRLGERTAGEEDQAIEITLESINPEGPHLPKLTVRSEREVTTPFEFVDEIG